MRIHRHYLSKKDSKKIVMKIKGMYPLIFERFLKDYNRIEVAKIKKSSGEEYSVYIVDNIPFAIELSKDYTLIPSMRIILDIYSNNGLTTLISNFKYVITDKGALKPILRGADIMIPGIIKHNEFNENDIVLVLSVSDNNIIPVAVGKALIKSREIDLKKKGKAVKNLHYIGDELWNIISSI